MKLVTIPKDKYDEYRLTLMFDCYKWDPQFLDSNTIARYALVITKEEHEELERLTEALDRETRAAEMLLNQDLSLAKPLALPKKVDKEIKKMTNYNPDKHVRLMRYDFHPTVEGKWAVSEVNSDVPGGFAEASLMPEVAKTLIGESSYWYKNFGDILVGALEKKVPANGRIMLVHCTSYSDDRQVMQFLGDKLEAKGFQVIYAASDHLEFKEQIACSILDDNEGKIDGIVRFSPLEWLTDVKPKRWQGYFDTTTVSCNHPIAIYAQTKRFPLVWDALEQRGVSMATWRELLPDTIEVKDAKGKEGYIYKPACGRVGENISIKEACKGDEYQNIMKDVKKHSKNYVAQKKFLSRPLKGVNGEEFHVCLGSYTVDGKHAGYYARVSELLRIDSNAADIPVLVDMGEDSITKVENCPDSNPKTQELSNPVQENMERYDGKEIYRVWAPTGKKWVDWVRPVPFIGIKEYSKSYDMSGFSPNITEFLDASCEGAAIIVDMPGTESIEEGIALARAGYRPIPIYNGTIEQQDARATVDNRCIGPGLIWGASQLAELELKDDALPAFLLDSNRLNRYKMDASIFDNSWDIYGQDMPSADYFLNNGIRKIIVVGDAFARDLRNILYDFQKKNIDIFYTNGYEAIKKIKLHKPKRKDILD